MKKSKKHPKSAVTVDEDQDMEDVEELVDEVSPTDVIRFLFCSNSCTHYMTLA